MDVGSVRQKAPCHVNASVFLEFRRKPEIPEDTQEKLRFELKRTAVRDRFQQLRHRDVFTKTHTYSIEKHPVIKISER